MLGLWISPVKFHSARAFWVYPKRQFTSPELGIMNYTVSSYRKKKKKKAISWNLIAIELLERLNYKAINVVLQNVHIKGIVKSWLHSIKEQNQIMICKIS